MKNPNASCFEDSEEEELESSSSSEPEDEKKSEIELELADVTFGELQKARSDGTHIVDRKFNKEKKSGQANKKTVPPYSFSGDQVKGTCFENPYPQITEDGNINQDNENSHNGIKFSLRLQQFEQMQKQHRQHAKLQAQSRKNSSSLSKSNEMTQRPEEPQRPLLSPATDISRPPSRSARRGGICVDSVLVYPSHFKERLKHF